jgi:hypothetical protein
MLSVLVRGGVCKTSQTVNDDLPKGEVFASVLKHLADRGRILGPVCVLSYLYDLVGDACASGAVDQAAGALLMAALGTICPLMRRQLDADEPISIALFVPPKRSFRFLSHSGSWAPTSRQSIKRVEGELPPPYIYHLISTHDTL